MGLALVEEDVAGVGVGVCVDGRAEARLHLGFVDERHLPNQGGVRESGAEDRRQTTTAAAVAASERGSERHLLVVEEEPVRVAAHLPNMGGWA